MPKSKKNAGFTHFSVYSIAAKRHEIDLLSISTRRKRPGAFVKPRGGESVNCSFHEISLVTATVEFYENSEYGTLQNSRGEDREK